MYYRIMYLDPSMFAEIAPRDLLLPRSCCQGAAAMFLHISASNELERVRSVCVLTMGRITRSNPISAHSYGD